MAGMLTVKDAAQRLGVPAKTVYKLTEEHSLACYRIGRAVRIAEDDLAAYMSSRYQPARPPASAEPAPRPIVIEKDPKETPAQARRRRRAAQAAWEEGYTGLDCLRRK